PAPAPAPRSARRDRRRRCAAGGKGTRRLRASDLLRRRSGLARRRALRVATVRDRLALGLVLAHRLFLLLVGAVGVVLCVLQTLRRRRRAILRLLHGAALALGGRGVLVAGARHAVDALLVAA